MAAYAITIFLGAFLLFQVQPLIGKYILPWFGGGASVWTTCMLFFQWLLLGGYLYSHLTSIKLRPRSQATLHLFVLSAAVLFLPIVPAESWKPSPEDAPTLRILLLLAASVGVPYFVLSTTGPLIQRWFNLAHPGANPWRLYALSNIGSLLALISYPFAVEPWLGRVDQAKAWSWGMIAFALCCAVCAWRVRQLPDAMNSPTTPSEKQAADASSESEAETIPTTAHKSLWITLPATASLLLLASTSKMCLDVASVPFLWILPLCLYLLSFILCFDRPWWYWRPVWCALLLLSFAAVCIVMEGNHTDTLLAQIISFSLALFAGCMVCHGELYRLKPPARDLTGFYLSISIGGALGGLLAAVAAPLAFSGYYEYHVSLLLVVCLMLVVFYQDPKCPFHGGKPTISWCVLLLIPGVLGSVLLRDVLITRLEAVNLSRNFYGALTVYERDIGIEDEHHFLLMHGGITHGLQLVDSWAATEPTTYYVRDSGIGMTMDAFPREKNRRIGVVGLGTGAMAAHGKEGDVMRMYEIDPAVRDLANSRFTYLAESKADIEIVMGDARLSLENEPPQNYDILAIDAFSSDAIPVHLITREAFEVYLRHVKDDGVIAFHVSNRHLNLEPVVASLAKEFGFTSWVVTNQEEDKAWWTYFSDWMLVTKNKAFLNHQLIWDNAYEPDDPPEDFRLWTDDYSSLASVVDWTLFESEEEDWEESDEEFSGDD